MSHARKSVALALLASLFAAPLVAQQATIQSLGWLNSDTRSSTGTSVSGDGTTLVGYSNVSPSKSRGFRWTRHGAIQDLGTIGSSTGHSYAYGSSWDGAITVGSSTTPSGYDHAFRGTAAGLEDLGTIGGITGICGAYDVSADGNFVVGRSIAPGNVEHAFRWTAGVMTDYGTIGNATGFSSASGVSADGAIVAGYSVTPSGKTHAFRGAAPGALQDLGTIGNFDGISYAFGISGDGQTVVGYSQVPGGFQAFKWTPSAGMQALPAVANSEIALGVNDDGSVIVGHSYGAGNVYDARIWIDGAGHSLRDLLINEYGADLTGWSSLEEVLGCSGDGRTLTGRGVYLGRPTAFRVYLPNRIPTATALLPQTVECVAGQHLVTLSTTVDDADGDPLTVTWKIDGQKAKTQANVAPGKNVSFDFAYPHGVHYVAIEVSDGSGVATAATTVTVQDTADPIVIVAADVRVLTDPGKHFATNVVLTLPTASDSSGHAVTLTSDAPASYPLGDTVVTWTATDGEGNQSTATQKVTVVNRKPRANAGKNVTVTTTSEKGAKVTLDGSRSSDPDEHKLKYAWRAKGVKLVPNKRPKASGVFPIGTTVVSLTVVDAAGARHRDTVRVIVKLKSAERRPRGSDANRSFAAATQEAGRAVDANASGGRTLSGLAYANAAAAYGDAAGDCVRWEEGQSEADAALVYAELRAMQRTYGEAATQALLSAYAETGDETLLAAYGYAAFGTAHAAADLIER